MNPVPEPWAAAMFALLGLALGILHFAALRRNADLFARGAIGRAAALQLLRLAATVAAFALAARQGALSLLLAAAGFLLARHVVVRRLGAVR
jgi:F1F0 ATPase subunit 2